MAKPWGYATTHLTPHDSYILGPTVDNCIGAHWRHDHLATTYHLAGLTREVACDPANP